MLKLFLAAALSISSLLAVTPAMADDEQADRPLTIAVFGDWPYSQNLLDRADLLINSINNDRDVSLVMHLGDIHSGSMPCTSAGILPPLPSSNPGWNQAVFHVFQQFNAPVVYTPGDNEWSDCHKSKQLSSGAPLKELASVRSLFFSQPGRTLGGAPMAVASQGLMADAAHPTDAQFIENVMWVKSKVVFATSLSTASSAVAMSSRSRSMTLRRVGIRRTELRSGRRRQVARRSHSSRRGSVPEVYARLRAWQ